MSHNHLQTKFTITQLPANEVHRSILLYGPSGTGKTSMSKLLAQALAMPFSDLNVEIETTSGRKISEIFANDGEPAFREMERSGLERLLASGGVISLDDGALTYAPTRTLAEAYNGRIILLKADPNTLIARLQEEPDGQSPHTKLAAMLERRGPHYAEFPIQLDTTHLSPTEAAWKAQILLGMFRVSGMGKEYDVRVAPDLIDSIGAEMSARGLKGPVALVSDENTSKYYAERAESSIAAAGYAVQTIIVPVGERHKTLHTVEQIWTSFLAAGIERGSTVVALGGGVVGDLTGFAAAMWLRGVTWVNVPTTLLSMCDSSLGGKTGADLPEGKNLIGAFHPPALVLADLAALATLPKAEIRNGLGEVIMHGILEDARLLEPTCLQRPGDTWEEIVSRSMAVKIKVIQEDPYEKGRRQALNLGHTIGHAVELVSGFQLKHGEAVAIGMVTEARLAEKLGLANPQDNVATRISEICQSVGLPTKIPTGLDRQAIHKTLYLDKKKAGGKVKFALPAKIGEVVTGVEVSDSLICEILTS